ncbi:MULTISPECIES: hypothetical protein [unclassified Acinetobacter]|uniref:hypothetical protein n=1 Tax=unclassified Acinetobacter TaxID=196816 RepID=UPI0035B6EC81
MRKLLLILTLCVAYQSAFAEDVIAFDAKTDPVVQKLKHEFENKPLGAKVNQRNAVLSDTFYHRCLSETLATLKKDFPSDKPEVHQTIVFDTCEYTEDIYNTYNVLLAADNMKKKMSEQEAYQHVIDSYIKNGGRSKTNAKMRDEIWQKINTTP